VSITVKTITSSSITFKDNTNNTSSQISPSTTTATWKVDQKYGIYRNRLTKKYSAVIGWFNTYPLFLKIGLFCFGVFKKRWVFYSTKLFCLRTYSTFKKDATTLVSNKYRDGKCEECM
jgi:hypothetical protein